MLHIPSTDLKPAPPCFVTQDRADASEIRKRRKGVEKAEKELPLSPKHKSLVVAEESVLGQCEPGLHSCDPVHDYVLDVHAVTFVEPPLTHSEKRNLNRWTGVSWRLGALETR